ncbi:phage Gp37/Gp68 family protein [Bdellovibrionota bacterium FG-1]
MSGRTSIEWTDLSWNPHTGCDKVSDGCKNCYAEKQAIHNKRMEIGSCEKGRMHIDSCRYSNGFKLTLHRDLLERPKHWRKPRRIFVNSMSDLFHKDVPLEFIQGVFKTVIETPRHTYQVLTKRQERLTALSPMLPWPKNLWMGVSVENNDYTSRIDHLRLTGAQVKFLSLEPLLGPLPDLNLNGINWVIVGGESGPKARPMDPAWVKNIRYQCVLAGVPFLFKQWGKKSNNPDPLDPTIKNKANPKGAKGGRTLDGRTWLEFPKNVEKKGII